MKRAYMHGENMLTPAEMPKGKSKKLKKFIVGHSESGHHHVLECADMDVIEAAETVIRVNQQAKLKHLKSFDIHETLTVEPGVYKITHKTEYNPWTKVLQRVFD